MLQHVSIEIAADQAGAALAFFALIGFERVEAPEEIAPYVTWVERAGTQFHLILIEGDGATVPPLGHAAVVVDEFDSTVAALREAGHAVEDARELWKAKRAFAIMPGGHRVELMAAPPPPTG